VAEFHNGIVDAVSAMAREAGSSKREPSAVLPSVPTSADGYW
jgi:hypothetical protein